MTAIIGLFFIMLNSPVQADTTHLPVLRNKIELLCPGADILEEECREDFTEIEFMCNGEKIEAGFDEKLGLVYIQKEADPDDHTYRKIRKKIEKSYPKWLMDDFHLIETTDTSFYAVEMLKNGIETNVYFTLDGAYFRPAKMSAGESVDDAFITGLYKNRMPPYNFSQPARIYALPEILREVSGIVSVSDHKMYLIQDELGAIFEYDLGSEEILQMVRFADNGDFEDVATDGAMVYVLRSDGIVYSFNPEKQFTTPEIVRIPVQVPNLEGLFYDSTENRLLMAGKSEPVNACKDLRLVYSIEPDDSPNPEVSLQISIEEINNMLIEHYPSLAQLKRTFLFNPSAIAIHPLTGETYILSASDRLLAIYKGTKLKEIYPLPAEMYYKPEGITFSSNGTLYISSEGIKNGWLNGRIFMLKFIR